MALDITRGITHLHARGIVHVSHVSCCLLPSVDLDLNLMHVLACSST